MSFNPALSNLFKSLSSEDFFSCLRDALAQHCGVAGFSVFYSDEVTSELSYSFSSLPDPSGFENLLPGILPVFQQAFQDGLRGVLGSSISFEPSLTCLSSSFLFLFLKLSKSF